MSDPKEDGNEPKPEKVEIEDNLISELIEHGEELTTLFAVRTTINQESNILKTIFFRFRILETIPDIKAMLVSPLLPGYLFSRHQLKGKFK